MMMRPYVICHMTTSIDGKVTGSFLGREECVPATEEYYRLNREILAEAFACGRVTMEESFTGGWYLELPAKIANAVSVAQFGNSYEFSVTDSDGVISKLMTIYVFTGQEREEQAITDNRFALYRTESTVFAAHLDVTSAAYNMNQETLIKAFHLITQNAGNGEK